MKWKQLKSQKELVEYLAPPKAAEEGAAINLCGLGNPDLYDVEAEYSNDNLTSVMLITSQGRLRIRKGDYSQLILEIPEPPTKKQVWIVTGTLEGLKLEAKQFESKYEAEHHYSRLQAAGVVATKVETTIDVYPE